MGWSFSTGRFPFRTCRGAKSRNAAAPLREIRKPERIRRPGGMARKRQVLGVEKRLVVLRPLFTAHPADDRCGSLGSIFQYADPLRIDGGFSIHDASAEFLDPRVPRDGFRTVRSRSSLAVEYDFHRARDAEETDQEASAVFVLQRPSGARIIRWIAPAALPELIPKAVLGRHDFFAAHVESGLRGRFDALDPVAAVECLGLLIQHVTEV